MPATSPTAGTNAPASVAPVLSDERALERQFRAHFAALADEAKTHLEDAANAAPKVVETAFRGAWEDRAQFNTEEDLQKYLHEAVKHGAARERARRASAHRFGGSGSHAAASASAAATNVDDAWRHLQAAMHPQASDAAARSAEHARHDAAAHMKDMAKGPNWVMPAAIGAGALVVALGGVVYFNRLGEQPAITGALSSPEAKTYTSPQSQLASIELVDGTKVLLTPESKLVVPKKYSGKEMRAVRLEGGANFQVAPGQAKPFQVRAAKAAVFATGTNFTVFAYPADSTVTVFVKDGSVSVESPMGTRTPLALAAGKATFIDKSGATRDPQPVELAEATSWLDHKVTLANRQVRDAVAMFKRWYGMDIKVPDLPLLDRPVSVDANLDSSRAAIAQVESSANLKFGWEGQTMVFRDAKATKAAPAKNTRAATRKKGKKK